MAELFTNLDNESEGLFKKLFEWQAPERHWTPKTRAWYVIYSFFFISIIFIAVLLQEYIFIIAVIAFSFLWFIQGSFPPQIATFTITTIGIKAFDRLYKWRNISHFWFSIKNETMFLNLEIKEDENKSFVRRLPLIISAEDDNKIFDILIQFVDYGDKEEISYNIFTFLLSGKYFDISNYMVVDENNTTAEITN